LHFVAEVVDEANFWRLRPEAAGNGEAKLAEARAKALIAWYRPKGFQAGPWQDIPGMGYCVEAA
jgi:hypothetical protein